MKKLYQILATLCILIAISIIFAPLALAISCQDFNNVPQSSASEKPQGPNPPNQPNPTGQPVAPPQPPSKDLAGKLVVPTEEPLGKADNQTTFLCSRQITCSTVPSPAAPVSPAPNASGNNTNNANAQAAGNAVNQATKNFTPPYIRQCSATFTDPGSCNSTPTDVINGYLSAGVQQNQDYTVCEPVMFYVAPAGNNLLFYYIGKIYTYLASIGGVIAVFTMILAGVMWSGAGDNSEQISKAKGLISKCITGLIVLFLSAIILYTINPNFFVISK